MSEPVDDGLVSDTLVFHGDGLCPHCGSFSEVEWLKSTVTWKCECCNYVLDLASTIKMCAIYRPERNLHDIRESLMRIRKAYGLDPALPRVPRRRSFWHPVEFAENFAVGVVLSAVWRRLR